MTYSEAFVSEPQVSAAASSYGDLNSPHHVPGTLAVYVGGGVLGEAVGRWGHMLASSLGSRHRRRGVSRLQVTDHLAKLDQSRKAVRVQRILVMGPRNAAGRKARAALKGEMAVVLDWACEHGIKPEIANFGVVVKAFTGNGNASGEQVIEECERRGFMPVDIAEALAIALFDFALSNFHKDRASILQSPWTQA